MPSFISHNRQPTKYLIYRLDSEQIILIRPDSKMFHFLIEPKSELNVSDILFSCLLQMTNKQIFSRFTKPFTIILFNIFQILNTKSFTSKISIYFFGSLDHWIRMWGTSKIYKQCKGNANSEFFAESDLLVNLYSSCCTLYGFICVKLQLVLRWN